MESFVEHLIFLSRMSHEINSLEHEYKIVTRLYTIARNFDMNISDEELALYRTLMPSFQHLKVRCRSVVNYQSMTEVHHQNLSYSVALYGVVKILVAN